MKKSKTEIDCQTDITVNPPILEDDEVANVCAQLGVQTSLTFQPDESLTAVTPELKKYLSHTKVYQALVVDGKIVYDHDVHKEGGGVDEEEIKPEGEDGGGQEGFVEGAEMKPTIPKLITGEFQLNMTQEEFEKNVQKILDNTVKNVYEFMAKIVELYEKSKDPQQFAAMFEQAKALEVRGLGGGGAGVESGEEGGEEQQGAEQAEPVQEEDEATRRQRALDYLEKYFKGEIPAEQVEVVKNPDGTTLYTIKEDGGNEVVIQEKLEIQYLKEEEEGGEDAPSPDDHDSKDDDVRSITKMVRKNLITEGDETETTNPDGTKSFKLQLVREKQFNVLYSVDILLPPKPEPTEDTGEAGEEAPTEDAPTEDAPTEDVPTEDVPTEDAPTEDVPTEDAPTEDAPTEDAPTEDAPTEDAPTEEAPSEDISGPPGDQPDQMGDTQGVRQPVEIDCECGRVHDAGAAPPLLTIGEKKIKIEFKIDGPKTIEQTIDGLNVRATISNTNQIAPPDQTIVVSFNVGDNTDGACDCQPSDGCVLPKGEYSKDCKCAHDDVDDSCSCGSSQKSCSCDVAVDDNVNDCECFPPETTRDFSCCCTADQFKMSTQDQQTGAAKASKQCGPECSGVVNRNKISSSLLQNLRELLTANPQGQANICKCGKNHSTNCMETVHNDDDTLECSCMDVRDAQICDESVQRVKDCLKTQPVKDSNLIDQHLKGLEPLMKQMQGISMQSYMTSSHKCVCVSSVQVIYKKTDDRSVNKSTGTNLREKFNPPPPINPINKATGCGCIKYQNQDNTPTYQKDTDYIEDYYDTSEDYKQEVKGISSLPEVANETKVCCKRTELPWMKLALPPPGSIKLQPHKKRTCQCQQKKSAVMKKEKIIGGCICLNLKKPNDAIESQNDETPSKISIQEVNNDFEHSPNCPCFKSKGPCPELKPIKLVYDQDNYPMSEDYMRPLCKMYPEDDGICDDKPEINWNEITLPTNTKLTGAMRPRQKRWCGRKDCGVRANLEDGDKSEKPQNDEVLLEDASTTQAGSSLVRLELKFSDYTEIVSTIISVDDGAQDQRTVSEFSTVSDIAKTLKRMDPNFVQMMFKSGEDALSAAYGALQTVGSQPFNISGLPNTQAVSMPAMSERNSDLVKTTNYDGQGQGQGRKGSGGFFDNKKRSTTFTLAAANQTELMIKAEFYQEAPLPFDFKEGEINGLPSKGTSSKDPSSKGYTSKCIPDCLGKRKMKAITDDKGTCNVECLGMKTNTEVLDKKEPEKCLCKMNKMKDISNEPESLSPKGGKDSDSSLRRLGSPILAAIRTVEREMKPLHDTLNELRLKIQSMDIPELENWKGDQSNWKGDQSNRDKRISKSESSSESSEKQKCFCKKKKAERDYNVNMILSQVPGPFSQKQSKSQQANCQANDIDMVPFFQKPSQSNYKPNKDFCVCLENVDDEDDYKKIVDESMGFDKMKKLDLNDILGSSFDQFKHLDSFSSRSQSDPSIKSSPTKPKKRKKSPQDYFQTNQHVYYQHPYVDWYYNLYSYYYPQYPYQYPMHPVPISKSSIEESKTSFSTTKSETYPSSKYDDSSEFNDSFSDDSKDEKCFKQSLYESFSSSV